MSPDVRAQAPALRAQSPALAPTLGGLPGGPGAGPGGDPQIGHIFRNMRAAMRLSRESVARRLATAVATIEDLENGTITALPHWPETVRIVRAYCELLRLDPEPLLWRLQQLLRQGVNEEVPVVRAAGGPPPLMLRNPPVREPVVFERPVRGGGGGLRRVLLLGTLPALLAGLGYLTVVAPATGYKAISLLPASLAQSARAGLDTIVIYAAPRRDGLKWIDVGDPRLRKGDKLQTTKAR